MIHWLRYFRNLLLRNLQLKVVSLTLAILLWIALNGEPKSEIGLKVPLEFRNSPKGVEVLGETNAVDIRLSASSSIVKRIDASEVTASIDLSDWTPGERTYSLGESNLSVPFGVAVTKIAPNKIRLRFEPTDSKLVNPNSGKTGGGPHCDCSGVPTRKSGVGRARKPSGPIRIDFNRQPRCFREVVNFFSTATPLC